MEEYQRIPRSKRVGVSDLVQHCACVCEDVLVTHDFHNSLSIQGSVQFQ